MPEPDGSDVDETEEREGGFIMAGSDAPAILEFVETPLDQITQGIDKAVDWRLFDPVRTIGYGKFSQNKLISPHTVASRQGPQFI